MAEDYTLDAIRGDDFRVSFQWLDENRTPVDLDDYDLEFLLYIHDAIFVYDDSPEILIEEGIIYVHIPGVSTTDWPLRARWKLRATSVVGAIVETIAHGKLTVEI